MSETEYKYTKSGKKVAVIGKLNNEEWIVQEIFVSNGKEFPAGENFVERTLLDEPAETYQDRRAKEVEVRLEKLKAQIEKAEESARVIRRKSGAVSLINYATQKYEDIDHEQLDTLFAFMAGEITHLVTEKWRGYGIVSFLDGVEATDSWHGHISSDGLRLVSLFGCNKDGKRGREDRSFSLDYRLNEYRDGSSSWGKIWPCSSLGDAVQKLDELLASEENASENHIELKEKYKLKNPTKKKVKEYYARCVQNSKERVASAKTTLKEKEKELAMAKNRSI